MLAPQSSVLDGYSARFRLGVVIPALLDAFAAILGDLSQARLGSRMLVHVGRRQSALRAASCLRFRQPKFRSLARSSASASVISLIHLRGRPPLVKTQGN